MMSDALAESFPEVILDPLKDYLDLNSSFQHAPALNQITIACDDLIQSISFYQKLDLLLIVKNAHYARFECPNGVTLSLDLIDDKKIRSTTAIYFEHPSLDNWIYILKTRGLSFEADLEDKIWLGEKRGLKIPLGIEFVFIMPEKTGVFHHGAHATNSLFLWFYAYLKAVMDFLFAPSFS